MNEHRLAIRDVLARVNNAWQNQRGHAMTSALHDCFADEIVMRGPGFQLLGIGRAFAIQSYSDFVTQAQVKSFSMEEPEIDVIGECSIAQYRWTMTYALSGTDYKERGYDVFALSRINGKWLIVWRAMLPHQS